MSPNDDILFQLNPLPTWLLDAQHHQFLDVNAAALAFYGYDKEQFIQLTYPEIQVCEPAEPSMGLGAADALTPGATAVEWHRKQNGALVRVQVIRHAVTFAGTDAFMEVVQWLPEVEVPHLALTDAPPQAITSLLWLGDLSDTGNFIQLSTKQRKPSFVPDFRLGDLFTEKVHPDDRSRVEAAVQACEMGKVAVVEAFRIDKAVGLWQWLEAYLEKSQQEQGVKIALYVKDVDAQMQAFQRLSLFERIITHTKDAVLVTEAEPMDKPGPRILYVNEAFSQMTGYAPHEVIGKTPRILQGPLSDYAELDKLGKSLRLWQPYEITTINYKKSGEPFWINFTVTPIADSNGYYTHWIAIERDVTKSKELEEHLTKAKEKAEDNQQKMKEAQRLARLGSWYYDFINQISYWSEETYHIWGVNPERGVITFEEHEPLVHPNDSKRFGEVIQNAIQQAIPYKMELQVRNADGTYKTVNTIGAPVFDANNQLIAYEGTTQDISDRIAIENELRAAKDRAERMQDIIAEASRLAKIGYIDHDFTTDVITWSEYMYQLFGLSTSDAIPGDDERSIFYDKVSRDKLRTANALLKSNGTPFDLELRMVNTQGEEVFIRKVIQPVFNAQNEVVGKRGVIQNITDEIYLRELNRDVARMVKLGSWRVDLVESTVYWSEQVHHIHETDPKSFVPTLEMGMQFYRSDFLPMVNQAVGDAIANGTSWDYEAVIVTAKNNEVWIRSTGNVELIDGKVVRLFGGFQDIHDKKMAQLELEKSLRELQDYKFSLDQSAIIAFTDARGIITDVNENFCEISGYSKEELVGNTHRLIGSQHHQAAFFKDLWRTIASGKVWRGEIKNKAKNGNYYWVDTTIVPFLNKEAKPEQYLAIRFDITDRKKAETDFLDSAERLRLATSSVKMGIWDWDVVNDVLKWDARMYELYGLNPAFFGGVLAAWQQGTHPDDVARVTTALQEAIVDDKEFNETFRVVWPDGTIRHIEAHAIVTRNTKGVPQRVIGGNIDITQKVASEELLKRHANELERYNESLRSIAWTQSHVVRAPLSRILSLIDLIELERGEQQSVEELLGHLKTATEEMDEIVKKIIREANEVTGPHDKAQ